MELDAESQQELPTAEDFGWAASALGKRGSVLRTYPLQIGSRVSCRAGLFDGLTAKWSELTFGVGGSEERIYGWRTALSCSSRRLQRTMAVATWRRKSSSRRRRRRRRRK